MLAIYKGVNLLLGHVWKDENDIDKEIKAGYHPEEHFTFYENQSLRVGTQTKIKFKQIHDDNKDIVAGKILEIKKAANFPWGRAWSDNKNIIEAIEGGYDIDEHFNFYVNQFLEVETEIKPSTNFNKDLEYQSLRQELLDTMKSEYNTFSIGLTGAIVVLGYNLTEVKPSNEFIFLVPVVILSLVIMHVVESYYTVLSHAVYIRIALEGEKKNWENWMFYRRNEIPKKGGLASVFKISFNELFFVLKYHVLVSRYAGFIILFWALGYSIYKNEKSFSLIFNFNLAVDWNVVGFSILWMILLIWWLKITINSYIRLKSKKTAEHETTLACTLREWMKN